VVARVQARVWSACWAPWLIVLGLIADGIVSLFDPRVRMSSARAW
jgi:hypothetical protein